MDKEQMAIKRLQEASMLSLHYYEQPLVMTYSGGKDSDVLIQLAINSGIPFEVQHNHTTADAPETVLHIRDTFKRLEENGIQCTINWPQYKGKRVSMWTLIPQKLMPPTRVVRYCCSVLKEQGGKDRFIATGVRWDESASRKKNRAAYEKLANKREERMLLSDNDEKRMLFENCRLKAKRVVNPIVDWTTDDVLDYSADQNICLNCLYKEGFSRVGCVGCPMAGESGREREFLRWPRYKRLYLDAFARMLAERTARGKQTYGWQNDVDVYRWWMEYDVLPGQMDILEVDSYG